MEDGYRLAPVVIAERAMLFTTINSVGAKEMGDHMDSVSKFYWGRGKSGIPTARYKNALRGSWVGRPSQMREQVFALQMMSRFAEYVDRPGPDGQRAFDAVEADFRAEVQRYWVNSALFPGVKHARRTGLEYRQRLVAARLGIRVARHRARHGTLPETLDSLFDDSFDKTPLGLFSGKPLVYQLRSDGLSLHDVDPETGEPVGRFEVSFPEAD